MQQNRRRKKQRPNYGKRVVDVCRSINGFGFTISGQQPCILSCIVSNSPADLAGLRAGDFLISVNGANVSKLPHEVVVQLINNSQGTIRLIIAENYYSDSSDEDNGFMWQNGNGGAFGGHMRTRRQKYPHHKIKWNRSQQLNRKKMETSERNAMGIDAGVDHTDNGRMSVINRADSEFLMNSLTTASTAHNIIHSPHASNECNISNVSAMVPPTRSDNSEEINQFRLEYRAVVGYLGTIEMPKQIATSSKLQTVRSCIRKLRQEKRQPTIVLMHILPNCLKLYNSDNVLIAKYPASRLSYVNSNNAPSANGGSSGIVETDMRFFGLVTSAIYADGNICETAPTVNTAVTDPRSDIVVSNSCHVFVIDLKLVDHVVHSEKAEQLSIMCTKDPVTNCCLEFPSSSEYVVNLIRSMYGLNANPQLEAISNRRLIGAGKAPFPNGMARQFNHQQMPHHRNLNGGGNSPQPSNHSEITTASSNSDSGIGFHNDFANISDRIVVVDFSGGNEHTYPTCAPSLRNNSSVVSRLNGRPVPFGVDPIRNIRTTHINHRLNVPAFTAEASNLRILHAKSKSLDNSSAANQTDNEVLASQTRPVPDLRLIRAMPDPISDNNLNDHSPSRELSASLQTSPAKYETIYCADADDTTKDTSMEVSYPLRSLQSADELGTESYYSRQSPMLSMARSCDDIMMSTHKSTRWCHQASFDDVSLLGEAPPPPPPARSMRLSAANDEDDYVFLAPPVPPSKKSSRTQKKSVLSANRRKSNSRDLKSADSKASDELLSYKLSPKVFGISKPGKTKSENLSRAKERLSLGSETKENDDRTTCSIRNRDYSVWGSLQDFEMLSKLSHSDIPNLTTKRDFLESAHSEPDLMVSKLFIF